MARERKMSPRDMVLSGPAVLDAEEAPARTGRAKEGSRVAALFPGERLVEVNVLLPEGLRRRARALAAERGATAREVYAQAIAEFVGREG